MQTEIKILIILLTILKPRKTKTLTMKFSTAILLATLSFASAFVPQSSTKAKTTLNQQTFKDDNIPDTSSSKMSQALPFQLRPLTLDGTLPGDVGFDPLGFSGTEESLMFNREAEIKHARLAMLAAAGWPLAELFDRKIANIFNADVIVDASNRNPSILNGGLGKINPLYWVLVLGTAAAIDLKQNKLAEQQPEGYFPGNLGWDPLGLYPEDEAGQRRMQLAEIKNGRLAMIAITAFAFQEAVQKYAVVNQTPFFFKPIQDVVDTYGSATGPIETHL